MRLILPVLLLTICPDVAAQDVDMRPVDNFVLVGKGKPGLVIEAQRNVKGLVLTLTRCDGKLYTVRIPTLAASKPRRIPLDVSLGRCMWKAELAYAGTEERWAMEFPVVVAKPMEIRISRDTVDLAEGRIAFSATAPVVKVRVVVFGEGGRVLSDVEKEVSTPPGGQTEVRFEPATETVTLVRLTAWDEDGFFSGVEISPWFVEVPHQEVNFEFGKADILPSEEGKLLDTLERIREALRKMGNEFKARLYVAGYTDTVGTREYNQDLSERRAAAIARFLRAQGLAIGICYQGMGEDALAVPTPDETPEPKNRRTIHVLANQPPPVSKVFPMSDWKCF